MSDKGYTTVRIPAAYVQKLERCTSAFLRGNVTRQVLEVIERAYEAEMKSDRLAVDQELSRDAD